MIAEPYIDTTTGEIEWEGLNNAVSVYNVWIRYADFEREKLRELGVRSGGIWLTAQGGYGLSRCKNEMYREYLSHKLTGYSDYLEGSESNRLLKRAEFLKAVCEKEDIPWLSTEEASRHPEREEVSSVEGQEKCKHCQAGKSHCTCPKNAPWIRGKIIHCCSRAKCQNMAAKKVEKVFTGTATISVGDECDFCSLTKEERAEGLEELKDFMKKNPEEEKEEEKLQEEIDKFYSELDEKCAVFYCPKCHYSHKEGTRCVVNSEDFYTKPEVDEWRKELLNYLHDMNMSVFMSKGINVVNLYYEKLDALYKKYL